MAGLGCPFVAMLLVPESPIMLLQLASDYNYSNNSRSHNDVPRRVRKYQSTDRDGIFWL